MSKIKQMTFQEIVNRYLNGQYDLPVKIGYKPEQLDPNTVIDEDKSVKWNREEVARINAEKRIEFDKMKSRKQFLAAQYKGNLAAAAKDECNNKNDKITLAIQEWDCPHCGTHHNRDYNAAINIQREGKRLLLV